MEYKRLSEIDLNNHIKDRIYATFLVLNVEVKPQKGGKKYLMFNCVDKDTILESKIFDVSDEIINKVIHGKVYYGSIDLKVWEKAPNGISGIVYNMDFADIGPESFVSWAEDLDVSQKIVETALQELRDTVYFDLVYPIMVENWQNFYTWAAGMNQHHTKLGDLMTHTVEIITLSRKIATTFNNMYGENFINLPLLLSSILLHDIGKLYELDVDTLTGNVEYSTDALLESHIMRGLTLIDNQAYKIKMGIQTYSVNELNEEEENKTEEELVEEQEALKLLRHCIASHHGKLEWGSPITPSVPEAFILHIADKLSAEMYKYSRKFKGIEPGSGVSIWTSGGLVKVYKDTTK